MTAPAGLAPLMTHVEERVAAITRRLRQLALSTEITVSAMSMLVGDANYLDDLASSYASNTRAPPPSEPWPIPTTRAELEDILSVARHAAYHEGWQARGESADGPTEAQIERAAEAIYDEPGPDGDALAAYLSEDAAMRISATTPEELRAEVMGLCRIAARAALLAARQP